METIDIKFPNDEIKNFQLGKPLVLIGANGAGKTRFSVKIEELNDDNYRNTYNPDSFLVQRITAQKSISLKQSINIKGLESAQKEAIIGRDTQTNKYSERYRQNPATHLLDDYDKALSLFFARNNKLIEEYHESCRTAQRNKEAIPKPIKSLKEQAEQIWNNLLPKRRIDLSGNEIHTKNNDNRYHGKEMSDGERVILYMIVQALSIKSNSLLIIDEPELHIHKAILNKLWDELEKARQDCVFMYITHDLNFAVSRSVSDILWMKSYNGKNKWDYEFLPLNDYSDLPEGLLFEIIGTEKKIIFVEGTKDSLDYLIYQEIYKKEDYHVIPCGGCSQVISYVKAKKGYSKFDHFEVYGIIDRDFRTENEIESLKENGIFTLGVAEVENLFIVPKLLYFVQERLGCDTAVVNEVKNFIIQIFEGLTPKQVLTAFSREINHQLSILNFDDDIGTNKIKSEIDKKFSERNINMIFNEKDDLYSNASDYKKILKIFNFKGLSNKISSKFGLQKGEYRKMIINLLKRSADKETKDKIITAIKPYIPEIP